MYVINPTIDFGDMFTNDNYTLICGDFEEDVENGSSVSATIVKINITNIVLFAIFALCLIGGIVLIVLKYKDFPLAIAAIKQLSANKNVATTSENVIENTAQPAMETPAATAATAGEQEQQPAQPTAPMTEYELYEGDII